MARDSHGGVPPQLFQFRRGEILDHLGRPRPAQGFQQPRPEQNGNIVRFKTKVRRRLLGVQTGGVVL